MPTAVERVTARYIIAALKPADKLVVEAFVRKEPADGRMLSTDGHSLYKDGAGGEKVAVWRGPKIAIVSTESVKSDEWILRYLVKIARRLVTWSYDRPGFEKSVEFDTGGDSFSRGQYDGWIIARVPGRDTPVGRLDWQTYKNDLGTARYHVKMIEVDPEFRRSGIATVLYQRLFRQEGISKKDLDVGFRTDDGAAFRSRAVLAGFIPEKFFNEKKKAIKALLQSPTPHPKDVFYLIRDDLIPLLKSIPADIQKFKLNKQALEAAERRVGMQVAKLEPIAEAYQQLWRTIEGAKPYPRSTIDEDVLWGVGYILEQTFTEKIKTLKKALSEIWSIDPDGPEKVARAALAKATPEERDALEKVLAENWAGRYLQLAQDFKKRALEAPAKRLIKKAKRDMDLLAWVDFFKGILDTSYGEDSLGGVMTGFDEFHVGRAKFIILAPGSSGSDNADYLKRIEQAHAVLKKHGFEKFWYGIFFVLSKDFHKLSPAELVAYKELGYASLESSAGTYHSHGDFIRITAPPDVRLVKTLVHEVGHRYWFKGMKAEQRARFNNAVKTNPSEKQRDFPSGPKDDEGNEKEVTPVSDYGASSIEEAFAEAFTHYCLGKDMTPDQVRTFRQTLATVDDELAAKVAERALLVLGFNGRLLVASSE